jgi:hypothetical protein
LEANVTEQSKSTSRTRTSSKPEPEDPKQAAAADFVAALGELQNPGRDTTARIETKSGGSFSYSYAGLDAILDLVRPVLARHRLALSQPFGIDANGLVTVRTRVVHALGSAIEGDAISRVVEGGPQEVGSFVTYARRYEVCSLLGIHPAGEDDDAAAAQPTRGSGGPAAEAKLPDPVIGGLHLSQRTDPELRDLVDAPPSQRVGAMARAWLDRRAREAEARGPDPEAEALPEGPKDVAPPSGSADEPAAATEADAEDGSGYGS